MNEEELDGPIPKDTIARILQLESFGEETRISAESVGILQKYMELFVREAVLRSIENREQKQSNIEALKKAPAKANPDQLQTFQHSFNGIELTHEDLEEISGLLLLDMS
ncbi:hypothetical protein TPHA_0F02910 [Tetrapisispora phaffii CBS 4417]|uniref:MHF histone-fold complex subunit 1 n=1 Tax=Tetrapisispora phaffii (strain ATCC 24235 / CBS 4417 / NBRC 1672 / NRRL Y-8282 / UCD 70-5) TaxID=1071381 RepID=G8BUI6_TETPH|nr:hypothetical protein TPHA_0F02910 [Tetrapisispora phaffii CBS 4417]CCE63772.1 hypothetical protein TPHA_0F02910 [Tetrapisispora phaffii CBS 4417]